MLSGNKATKHRVKSFFILLHKEIISLCMYFLKQVMNAISRIKMKVFVHVFFLLVCLSQLNLTAQNKITLSGKVTDQQGTPLSLVTIAVENTTFGTYTDDSGHYSLQVSPGKHTFVVSSLGYQTIKISLDLHHNKTLDFQLEESSVNLNSVEVYGKSNTQKVKEGALTVNAVDIKPLVNSLNNLNTMVNRTTGIKIREEGGVGSDFELSINGMSGNSVRYFIDGMPLSTNGSGTNLANLPVNIIDRIEIYKGVVPANLGADALGGAINIITNQEKKNYLDASYGIGSFHTHKIDINGQFVDPKTDLVFRPTIGVNYSKNDYTMKGVEVWDEDNRKYVLANRKRFHDDYFSLLGQLEIGFVNKSWTDAFFISASYSKVDKELQTGSIQSKVYGMAERQTDAWNVSGRYLKHDFLIKDLQLNASVSHTWDQSLTIDTAFRKYNWDGTYIESPRNEITGRDRSLRHYKRPLTIVRTNIDYRLNDHHSFNLNYLLNRTGNDRYDEIDTEFEPSNDVLAKHILGLSYNQSFFEGKMDNTFFFKDYINHLEIGQQDLSWITGSDGVPASSTKNHIGYGLGSRYSFWEKLALKISFEHSVRLPLSRELLGNGTTIYPNIKLKPESSNNYNVGTYGSIRLAPSHLLYYEANGFYRNVDNYIHAVISESEGMMQYENVSSVKIKGIEGEVRYTWSDHLQAIVNCSYQDARDQKKYKSDGKPSISYKNKVPNRPWLFSNAELNYTLSDLFKKNSKLRLSYNYQYVHWFFLTWEGYGALDSKSKIPTQHLHTATVSYSWAKERYNLSFECNNLFDSNIYDNYMLQKPGRSFFCKFRLFIN